MLKFAANCPNKKCGHIGIMRVYVGFYPQEKITEAHKQDRAMPVYGCHLGLECPKCGTWIRWIKQDENILGEKFYFEGNIDTNIRWETPTVRLYWDYDIEISDGIAWRLYSKGIWFQDDKAFDRMLDGLKSKTWFTDDHLASLARMHDLFNKKM